MEKGSKKLGLPLSKEAISAFLRFYDILTETNKVMNLTSIEGEKDTANLHFLDSIAILNAADFRNRSVIDVGTGAGFPGIPVKIAEPTVELTLLDALNKRVGFLKDACEATGLSGVRFVHARAEEASLSKEHREKYDIAVSRAVARMNVLCELCMPYVKEGGIFIAMKSTDSEEELSEAENAIKTLGGRLRGVCDYEIPDTGVIHRAIVIEKTSMTPAGYPRRNAKIVKAPL